jgi:hypothetical protein
MTLPVGPSGEQLAVELAAAALVTADLRRQLQEATRQITTLYLRLAGGIGEQIPEGSRRAFADAASRIIGSVSVDIQANLWAMVMRALAAGQASAVPYLGTVAAAEAGAQATPAPPVWTADWLTQLVGAVQGRVMALLLSAQAAPQIGLPAVDYSQVMSWMNQANQALTTLERDTRWATNAAYNQAIRDLADEAGMDRMWVAERDACLHCLAYSGQIAKAHQPYPPDLTFYLDPAGRPKPLRPYPVGGQVWGPPLHPNCRCDQRPVPILDNYPVMPWETREYHPAEALQREARRTVLKGMSGSDSLPARLRATSALLARGAGLPRSVEAKARAAVKAGAYRG